MLLRRSSYPVPGNRKRLQKVPAVPKKPKIQKVNLVVKAKTTQEATVILVKSLLSSLLHQKILLTQEKMSGQLPCVHKPNDQNSNRACNSVNDRKTQHPLQGHREPRPDHQKRKARYHVASPIQGIGTLRLTAEPSYLLKDSDERESVLDRVIMATPKWLLNNKLIL
jgi:hypothetical protein